MCHSRLFIIAVILVSVIGVRASADDPAPTVKKKRIGRNAVTVAVQYMSWAEHVNFSQAGESDHGQSEMVANALTIQYRHLIRPRFGYALSGSFLYGVADVGGGSRLGYSLSNQSWLGAMASARLDFRISSNVEMTLGPVVIERPLSLPVDPTGISATMGKSLLAGGSMAFEFHLSPRWSLREEMGLLSGTSAAFWALGLGATF